MQPCGKPGAIENESVFKFLQTGGPDADSILDNLRRGRVFVLQTGLETAANGPRPVEATFVPVLKEEVLAGMYVVFLDLTDITAVKLLEKELKTMNRNLAKAQSLAQIGSWEVDVRQNRSLWSEEACRIYGIDPEKYDRTFEGFLNCVHPDDIIIFQNSVSKAEKERYEQLEFRIVRPDGSVRYVCQLLENVFDEEGNLVYIYGTTQDITDKKKMQKDLELTQELMHRMDRQFQALSRHSNDIFEILAPDGTIKYISQGVQRFSGADPGEIVGRNVLRFFKGREKQKLAKMLNLVLREPDENVTGELSLKARDGKELCFEVTLKNLLRESAIHGIIANWCDVTKRTEIEKNMAYIATHDELTKLPNRVYLKNYVTLHCEEAREKGCKFSLMILDINEFKNIAGQLGYLLGDQLLLQIAERLRRLLGEGFLCRCSGDQFAIVLAGDGTMEEYERQAQAITGLFRDPLKVDKYELHVSAHMGISIFPDDALDFEALMKCAASASERARGEGKNRYGFSSGNMEVASYKRFMLKNDLRRAMDNNQLKAYFQPIVNLKTGSLLAAEALIRWEHPAWGLVLPGEFIPLAEETGLIIDLGRFMLREVCRICRKWLDKGLPPVRMAVNYSSMQFLEKDFMENNLRTIEESGMSPDFLIIEIVESVLINNFDQVTENIQKLQAKGIKIALDDFGTGFSSLEYLNRFSIDILKIDPVRRDTRLCFSTGLAGKEIEVYGSPVWVNALGDNLYEYGLEFAVDDAVQKVIPGLLNEYQVRLGKDGDCDGRFVSCTLRDYFGRMAAG